MIADDIGFTTDEDLIAERASDTPAKADRLLSVSQSLLAQINAFASAQVALGTPGERHLPPGDVEAARDIGFEPVCFVHWGHWPIPLMRTPNWIGPDGFVKLDVYGKSRRYLTTYFDDGTALSSKPTGAGGANIRTTYIDAGGDLHEDYRAHLEAAKRYCDETGARPLYRPTAEHVIQCWRIYSYLHVPPYQGLMMMAFTWSLPAVVFYTIASFL